MINAILLNTNQKCDHQLKGTISNFCPELELKTSVFKSKKDLNVIEKEQTQIVFFKIDDSISEYAELLHWLSDYAIETILIAPSEAYIFEVVQYKISGYLINPLNPGKLKSTVANAIQRITKSRQVVHLKTPFKSKDVIGVPTMDGYEFIAIKEIIRCESYLKCTRVITTQKTDIISSYNIGHFAKLLSQYHFFAPHQSHLVNLSKLKKYLKEGSLIMVDGSAIPIARRRRQVFLSMVLHG